MEFGFIGLFRAIVIETNKFIDTGFISVHISGVSVTNDDFYNCLVKTTFGGLDQSGTFCLPPIGSTGYVLFVRNDPSETPVWMGSPMVPADLNTEKQEREKSFVPPEVEDHTTIVLRSQYTKNETGGEDLTSPNNKVETIIKINEQEFVLTKPKTDQDKYTYRRSSYNILNEKNNTISIKDTEIFIKYYTSDNKKFTLKLGDDGIEINYNNVNKITMSGENILLNSNNKSKIEMTSDGVVNIRAVEFIKILGEDDYLLKWSKYNELVNAFNAHTHEPGSDSPSSGPPLPNLTRPSLINTSGVALMGLTTNPVGRTRYSSNKMLFGAAPSAIDSDVVQTTQGLFKKKPGGGFIESKIRGLAAAIGGLFGTSYTNATQAKSEKNKL